MNVLITTAIFPPDIGGPASYVPKIAKALAEKGHNVTVLTMADEDSVVNTEYGRVVKIDRRFGVGRRKLRAIRVIGKYIKSADLAYVNGMYEEMFIYACFRKMPAVAKVVGDWAWERMKLRNAYVHTIDEFQHDKTVGIKGSMMRVFRSLVLWPYANVIVPSNYLGSIVNRWRTPVTRKVGVVYNGIEIPDISCNTQVPRRNDVIRIITVCRLVSWKGVDGLIDLTSNINNLELVVVGDGPEREKLESLTEELGVSNRVCFLGVMPRVNALAEVQASDIFVLNSSYEGLPHVLIEAMALSKPVIAKRSGGSAEVVEHGKTGFIVDNYKDLSATVLKLLDDVSLRQQLGVEGSKLYNEKYTEVKMLDKTVRILEKIAGV